MGEDFLIILDSSGSMNEEGKQTAGEYLLRALVGFVRDSFPEVRCEVYTWSKSVSRYGDNSIGDEVKLGAGALVAFVTEHQNLPIILISDGNFPERDYGVLAGLSGVEHIRAVMVGADANRPRLQRIIGRERVFESADAVECARQLLLQR